jgi:hypothetical protein
MGGWHEDRLDVPMRPDGDATQGLAKVIRQRARLGAKARRPDEHRE